MNAKTRKYSLDVANLKREVRNLDSLLCSPSSNAADFSSLRSRLQSIRESIEGRWDFGDIWNGIELADDLLELVSRLSVAACIAEWSFEKEEKEKAESKSDAVLRLASISGDLERLTK